MKSPKIYTLSNDELLRVTRISVIHHPMATYHDKSTAFALGYVNEVGGRTSPMVYEQQRAWTDYYLDSDVLVDCVSEALLHGDYKFYLLLVPIYPVHGTPVLRCRAMRAKTYARGHV